MTSNPAIFAKSIAETHDYDADIERLAHLGGMRGAYLVLRFGAFRDRGGYR